MAEGCRGFEALALLAPAALLPPANDEVVLKDGWIALGDRKLGHAGAAVQGKRPVNYAV